MTDDPNLDDLVLDAIPSMTWLGRLAVRLRRKKAPPAQLDLDPWKDLQERAQEDRPGLLARLIAAVKK